MSQGVLNRKREIEYTQKQIEASVCTVRKASPEEIEKILNERGVSMGKRGPKPGFKRDKRVNETELADQQTIKGEQKTMNQLADDLGAVRNSSDSNSLDEILDFSKLGKYVGKTIVFGSLFKMDTAIVNEILELERTGYLKRVSKGFNYFRIVKLNKSALQQLQKLQVSDAFKEISIEQAKDEIKKKRQEVKKIIKDQKPVPDDLEPIEKNTVNSVLEKELATENKDVDFKGGYINVQGIKPCDNAANIIIPIARPPLGITPKSQDEKLLDEIISDHIPVRKPPLGIAPRKLHDRARLSGLISAICRYIESSYEVPLEWVIEYNELVCRVK